MVSNERVPPTAGNICSLSELGRNESIEQRRYKAAFPIRILELNEGNTFLHHVSVTQFHNTSVVQPRFEERLVYRGCTVVDNLFYVE